MKDRFGQKINHMNISVTDECNLNCRYCRPEEGLKCPTEEKCMRMEDFLKVIRAAAGLGIQSFTIMGGEPVLWKPLMDFIRELKAIPEVERVTLQTNGLLIYPMLNDLKSAGLDRISFHMDTTQSQQYKKLTRGKISSAEAIKPVWQSVALEIPTTILCVLQEETKNEVLILAGLAKYYPLDVKFVEVRPIRWHHEVEPYSKEEALKRMKISYPDLESIGEDEWTDGTEYYRSSRLKGRIGLMNDGKNILHLSNTGVISRGFGETEGRKIMDLIRNDATDAEVKAAIRNYCLG